jgi:hypothetical protein
MVWDDVEDSRTIHTTECEGCCSIKWDVQTTFQLDFLHDVNVFIVDLFLCLHKKHAKLQLFSEICKN